VGDAEGHGERARYREDRDRDGAEEGRGQWKVRQGGSEREAGRRGSMDPRGGAQRDGGTQ
jgi:hypothetical protein